MRQEQSSKTTTMYIIFTVEPEKLLFRDFFTGSLFQTWVWAFSFFDLRSLLDSNRRRRNVFCSTPTYTMGRRRCYSLCLVVVLHDGLVHSLAPRVSSLTRVLQQHGNGFWSPMEPASAAAAPAADARTRSQHRHLMMASSPPSPFQQNDHDHDHDDGAASFGSSSSASSPVKAVLSSLLATAVVLTGVVPGWDVQQHPTMSAMHSGVPAAAATTFNAEQAAVAETWVRGLSPFCQQYCAAPAAVLEARLLLPMIRMYCCTND